MNEADAINIIKDCCEGIYPYWEEHLKLWDGDEDRGYYNDMGVLAHYVVKQYSEGKTKDFEKIFNACENIYETGSEEAIDAVDLGFIEGILFISSHELFGTHAIEPWMGPITLKEYVGFRDAFDALAKEKRKSYSPMKKLLLTVKSKIFK